MLATFCLRLACGLIASLCLLLPLVVNPRFYRAHFLIGLGLTAIATVDLGDRAGNWLWGLLLTSLVLAALGSLVWSLEGHPGGKLLVAATAAATTAVLVLHSLAPFSWWPARQASITLDRPAGHAAWLVVNDLTSASVLGAATTAMLAGHSYLMAPAMSLTPLRRLLAALFVVIVIRVAVAAVGLWSWTRAQPLLSLEDATVYWLPLRWCLGFVGPLILGWMAREAAKIRSTQSATGILYVAVIFCFLGELTSLLLQRNTGWVV